jgi:tetratricopeptide (TPR) repeat protein
VLSTIDGVRDIRGLATTLAQSDFDVAKIVYGLLSTGVIELRKPDRQAEKVALPMGDPAAYVTEARRAMREDRLDAALDAARQGVLADGESGAARLVLAEVMLRMGRVKDASDELRAAGDVDPLNADVHRMRGIAAAARGDFDDAVNAWGKFLTIAPAHPEATRIRTGLEAVARLRAMVESATSG